MRWRTLSAAILTGALLATACGGGEEPAATPAPTTPEAATSPTAGGADAAAEVEQAVSAWGTRDVQVTYQYQWQGDNGSGSGTARLAWQPAQQRWRVDIQQSDGTGGTMIALPDRYYVCSDEDQMCAEVQGPPLGAGLPPTVIPFGALWWDTNYLQTALAVARVRAGGVDVSIDRSSREIAGVTARCWTVVDHTNGQRAEACFSDEGVLLYLRVESGGDLTEAEATEFSTEAPPDSLFEPPYPVQQIPFPGGQMPPGFPGGGS